MADTPLHPKKLVELGRWKDVRPTIWGDSYNWSWVRPWNQLKYLVIHHSVTKHDATAEDVALLHKARGWGGIGYHFVIEKSGLVKYVGDISTARANVANLNEQVIGICLIGDFTKHLPSDEQIESAHDLCKFFLTETPSLPTLVSWDQLKGHKDFNPTACPGSSFPNDMRQRIIDRRIYSPQPDPIPVPPTPTPQPPTDDLYRVMYKGEQLGAYAENPITKIDTLEDELKTINDKKKKAVNFISSAISNLNEAEKQLS